MKTGKVSVLRRIAGAVVGILGFAACEDGILDPDNYKNDDLCMYGSPHADFRALGSATDEGGNPISGIRVVLHKEWSWRDTFVENDTLYTDSKGEFLLKPRNHPEQPHKITIVFDDVDGEENGGEFESLTVQPEIVQIKDGDHNWFTGSYEAKADVQLKKK